MTGTLPVGELRHELRTPVNHIVGYAEMLLEDAAGPEHAARRAALETTIRAAREALQLINVTLNPTRSTVSAAEVAALSDALRGPQATITAAVGDLLASGETPPASELAADLKRVLAAAERLVPAPTAGAPPSPRSAAGTPNRPSPEIAAAPGPDVAAAGRARVLVVDDIEDNREVLMRRLRREGYLVDSADNGRRALELIASQPFDLVLLDVMMPELDGYAVLDRIKGDPATRDIPVIMISALDEMAGIARCIEHGAEDYLPKPFDPVLLRARLGACLEKKRLRDAELEYMRQVARVIDAATAVESGAYQSGTLEDLGRRSDELGRLARVFDAMATQVRTREERLRDRVRELRQEIDVARRLTGEHSVPQEARNLEPGQIFAERYEILSALGSGGMGTVYRARDQELDEIIAIKTLLPQVVGNPTLVERFKSELKLARRISHPNVVRMHDFGEASGVCYLTMEYVEGITVRELIDTRGPLAVPSVLAIAGQLGESLTVAHEHGVIHRDIKPQNLLLDAGGVLKVMDFGVARLAERSSTLTEAGLVVGTPAYMSPEQLLGDKLDQRSDLYAVGVVLYECLTARLPFQASSPISLIAKVLSETPPAPTALNAAVTPALSALIVQLLAKRPEDRLQTAAELAQRCAHLS